MATFPSFSVEAIGEFVSYAQSLKGDEKGEAQPFLENLFRAFGRGGVAQAGATLEYRIRSQDPRKSKTTKYADLHWDNRLLLEMKKRGTRLEQHVDQVRDYWIELVPNRPKYVVLCNFDEFWIYDFNTQLYEPMDKVALADLPQRYTALDFLRADDAKPLFKNNRVAVTRKAAGLVAEAYKSIKVRLENKQPGSPRPEVIAADKLKAQRFILQCLLAMFSEDFHLLPEGLFTGLLAEAHASTNKKGTSYDLLGALFRQMNSDRPAEEGRFAGVDYFNGGLFAEIDPVPLEVNELTLLKEAAAEDWSKVEPAIFGTIFEASLDKGTRHALGAHFTSEADISRVVRPTIVDPWRRRIDAAKTLADFAALHDELAAYQVLDPACGSGNFLYVAYRELKRLEVRLLVRAHDLHGDAAFKTHAAEVDAAPRRGSKSGTSGSTSPQLALRTRVSVLQFHGLDIQPFAVELARLTLMLAKELSVKETKDALQGLGADFRLETEKPLPLDNLNENIHVADALFDPWPEADAIIGNPPYQSKNKMVQELGPAYIRQLRLKYPAVPGRADYCVYWFRRAQDQLKTRGRAGLVGTNTIRENYSREGGLDYIINSGGTLTDAVSTMPWAGEAAVHVSIVNWVKGNEDGLKTLHIIYEQFGQVLEERFSVLSLSSSLSANTDVSAAKRLAVNCNSKMCYQGQSHGHKGFLVQPNEAKTLRLDATSAKCIHPYLIGDELVGGFGGKPTRYAIDLNQCSDILHAQSHVAAFKHLKTNVLPTMRMAAEREKLQTGSDNGPRQGHYKKWWRFWRGRSELMNHLEQIPRYVAMARVTKRPIFEFVSSEIHPNDAIQVFAVQDDYSFGILQSGVHWAWFTARCSTLEERFRYTSDTVFDTFPWPQSPAKTQVRAIADAAVALRNLRRRVMADHNWSLRDLYRTLDTPGANPLRDAHARLDTAVRAAYGMPAEADVLAFLLDLNLTLAAQEANGQKITAPGLPKYIKKQNEYITSDCIEAPSL